MKLWWVYALIPPLFPKFFSATKRIDKNKLKKRPTIERDRGLLGFWGTPLSHLEMEKWTFSRVRALDLNGSSSLDSHRCSSRICTSSPLLSRTAPPHLIPLPTPLIFFLSFSLWSSPSSPRKFEFSETLTLI